MNAYRAFASPNFSQRMLGFSKVVQKQIQARIDKLKKDPKHDSRESCFPHPEKLRMSMFDAEDDDGTAYHFTIFWRYGKQLQTIDMTDLGVIDLGPGGKFSTERFAL